MLDHDDVAVGGLYAAGADAGGLSNEGYAGGLAPAFITGRHAARAALAVAGSGEPDDRPQEVWSRSLPRMSRDP